MKYIAILLLCGCLSFSLHAQKCSLELKGHVEDADTKEKLEAAVVTIKELNRQLLTDAKGDFTFSSLCVGKYTILITHIDCEPLEREIYLNKNEHLDLFLPHAQKELGEVVVTSRTQPANTGIKMQVSQEKMEQSKGQSLAEVLSNLNGVTMLQTGTTAAKPVIHGLHGNRIIMVNNGVRQEGQQWGNEHAPEIDPFVADKLTVVQGVDQMRYGSDAIAGIILVDPKALRSKVGKSATLNLGFFTNNKQYVGSAIWEERLANKPHWAYRLQGTFKKGANVNTPTYRLNTTANEEMNFSATLGFKKEKFDAELYYSVFNNTVGIFRGAHIGNLTDLQNAIERDRPSNGFIGDDTYAIGRPRQAITHHLVKLKTTIAQRENKINILLAAQLNDRLEYDIVRSSNNKGPQMELAISTFSQEINWESAANRTFRFIGGVNLMQQDNAYNGRYFIPNYTSFSGAGFGIVKFRKHKWESQAGFNIGQKSIHTTRMRYGGTETNYDFDFTTSAGSFNVGYDIAKNWKANATFIFASRAPYVNELLSNGIHHGTATYERGNIDLKPEKSVNISAGVQYHNPVNEWEFHLLVYNNSIQDFIYQLPRPTDPILTIAGAFPLVEYAQTNARLTGADLSATIPFTKSLLLKPSFSFLEAKNKKTNDWLIWMPSNRLRSELTYKLKDTKKWTNSYVSVEFQHVMEQKNIPDETVNGRQDYKLPPPAYSLFHVHAATDVVLAKIPLTIGLSIKNLLDTQYRDYLNSMRYFTDEPGRNINLRLKINLFNN